MRTARPRYRARGILFVAICVGMLAIAVAAAMTNEWIVTVTANAINLWMTDLTQRDLAPQQG